MGPEPLLVVHRRHIFNEVAEVEVLDIFLPAEIHHGQDAEGAQAPPALIGIKKEVDRVEEVIADIDNPVTDQAAFKPVTELIGRGYGIEKES